MGGVPALAGRPGAWAPWLLGEEGGAPWEPTSPTSWRCRGRERARSRSLGTGEILSHRPRDSARGRRPGLLRGASANARSVQGGAEPGPRCSGMTASWGTH